MPLPCLNGKNKEVPHYQVVLDFLDLRAQASETSFPGPHVPPLGKKPVSFGKTVASFAASADSGSKCKRSQRLQHTMLHVEPQSSGTSVSLSSANSVTTSPIQPQVISNAAVKLRSSSLLMTCQVLPMDLLWKQGICWTTHHLPRSCPSVSLRA